MTMMRIRVNFKKTDAMRFTSHLDLHRTWERTLRRARLPLAYTQGYSPHPRINLACALPLGFTGDGEIVDIWLENHMTIADIESALLKAIPPGISINRIDEIGLQAPSLQSFLLATEYIATLFEQTLNLPEKINEFLDSGSMIRERRGKTYDLRPLLLDLALLPPDVSGNQRLHMRLTAGEGSTGRPDEVISALGITTELVRIHRVNLIFTNEFSPLK